MAEAPGARIGLDMHVVDGLHQGSRMHILELFSRVVELLPEMQFFCFLEKPEYLEQHWPRFTLPNVTLVPMPHKSAPQRLLHQLPQLARRCRLDLLHTQYIAPLGLPCASAVTVHDILFESYPQYFSLPFRLRSRLLVRHSARTAALVCTVSHYSLEEIVSTYGISRSRMLLTPNGVSTERFHPRTEQDSPLPYDLRAGEYILTVGRLEPRKNHLRLLEAYCQLPEPRPPLVVVGKRDFGFETFLARLRQLGLLEQVRVLEQVDDALLPMLYRNARLFMYPSLAEGFGMPALEAMASGVPVVTSNTTSLPEVAGLPPDDAALLCDPAQITSIAAALAAGLSDEEGNRQRVARGMRRVQAFQWEHSAATLAEGYRRVLSKSA